MKDFQYLGKPRNEPTDTLDLIPWAGETITVRLECTEFSSLCPVTSQPDYGQITIEYVPNKHLAETKSLKLFLWRWRDQHIFNEVLIDQMAGELYRQLSPHWLRVTGSFNPRGGIRVTATAERGTPVSG